MNITSGAGLGPGIPDENSIEGASVLHWAQLKAIYDNYGFKVENLASLVDGKAVWCLIITSKKKLCNDTTNQVLQQQINFHKLLGQNQTSERKCVRGDRHLENHDETLHVEETCQNHNKDNGRKFKAIMEWRKEMAQNSKANEKPVYAALQNFPCKEFSDDQREIGVNYIHHQSVVMKRAQNVAQAVLRTRSTLSAWSCMGARRRPVGNAPTDDFSETSLILEKHGSATAYLVPTFSTASIDDLRTEVTASSWLNDLRDQVEQTRVLNVVFRTALGSPLPSMANARAKVAGAGDGAMLCPVSSSAQVVMKRAQNVAQVVRTGSTLSAWSCMGARRRPVGNARPDDFSETSLILEKHADFLISDNTLQFCKLVIYLNIKARAVIGQQINFHKLLGLNQTSERICVRRDRHFENHDEALHVEATVLRTANNGRKFKAFMEWWKQMAQNSKANEKPVYAALQSFRCKEFSDDERDLVPTFSTASIDDLLTEVTASSWLNDLRDQVEQTRVLNVVFCTALGSRLPSMANARAKVLMKRAQNVAQELVRTGSTLSALSCMGARRRPVGNAQPDGFSETSLILEMHADFLISENRLQRHRAFGGHTMVCGSDLNSGFEDELQEINEVSIMSASDYVDALHNLLLSQKQEFPRGRFCKLVIYLNIKARAVIGVLRHPENHDEALQVEATVLRTANNGRSFLLVNDLRDQVEQTRVLNVIFRSATALGSRLPSMANARAKVACAGAMLRPVSSSTQGSTSFLTGHGEDKHSRSFYCFQAIMVNATLKCGSKRAIYDGFAMFFLSMWKKYTEDMPKEQAIWYLEPYNESAKRILILIEDKTHYLWVLAPQIGATWMQRGTINKIELFMYEPVLLVGETGTRKTTLVHNLAARLGQKLTILRWQIGVGQAGWVASLGQNQLFKYMFKQVRQATVKHFG
ncbi:Lipase, class 3 [Artemisia annua]|uniref:Lipase, class 3 n=1 Tax=Artemisia annua TaxID=35608 RepID=A0A2U1PZJ4_ARTAN|nr:Lipase, class 3 [Artemisia annua]